MRPVVSPITEELYAALGPWADADGEDTGWALLHFCESIAKTLQPLIDVIRDLDDGTPGWAIIMDPDRAPAKYLPWLGQFVGVPVDTYQTEAEQRAAIKAEQGWQRGTPAYFLTQVRKWLQGTQHIDLTERDTSAYHFAVRVYRGELAGLHYDTLDAMYGSYNAMDAAYATYNDMTSNSEQQLIDTAKAAKPAGLVMAMTVTPGLP